MSAPPSAPPKAESLSLSEMLRIMDVATEMRTQRETVEKEFAIDETKRLLREKLLKTTEMTGERVTEAEIDAAIESYFSTLYTYREPDRGWAVTLARLYVLRGQMLILCTLVATLIATGWLAMRFTTTHFSKSARLTRQATRLQTSIEANLARAQALAREPAVIDQLSQWEQQVQVAREQLDTDTLNSLNSRLTDLINSLNEDYDVQIRADPLQQTGFPRLFDGKAAYYLIVFARNDQGQIIRRKIENAETGKSAYVDRWAEQVPKDVYDRIAADKKSDGVLGETLFAVKERGYRNEEIRLKGTDGNPIQRQARITVW